MKTRFLDARTVYDGTQLRSLYNYLNHGLLGDSVVSWVGPCSISFEHMVDGEDLNARAEIRGDEMLHFIIELFDSTLFAAVAIQRLFAAIVRDELAGGGGHPTAAGDGGAAGDSGGGVTAELRREGDDLYLDDRKLSISIATQSPVSSLIHFAVNVVNEGTPVKTLALVDLGVQPATLARQVMATLETELESIRLATRKVRWVP